MDARGWQVNRNQLPPGLHAMVTAQHLAVVDDYLADLGEAVAAVRADPELARQGGAATYGMLAHVPLRGMVKKKVLEMYSKQYRAGGAELDIGGAGNEGGSAPGLLDRIVRWYVQRQSRR